MHHATSRLPQKLDIHSKTIGKAQNMDSYTTGILTENVN